jgi:hypothetical protein
MNLVITNYGNNGELKIENDFTMNRLIKHITSRRGWLSVPKGLSFPSLPFGFSQRQNAALFSNPNFFNN